ncbi:NAD(P)-binding protein [Tilletiopsis washingtonensis]|uniref:NAD(P)-binding protein n=1 Tax=Tilletiopsis washingtonensis TaxID=58919 RepID=A0A316Z613_9BASI|nr:NAD(P)-binding protein [Tilletiopsis washingtonensis]PWN97227.1 NAD(P)-binding protein [Tilletiopsis washingtonensis]
MSDAAKSAYEATVARLTAIRAHLESAPRRGRLAGKVAVVTGAGSRSGIGRAAATLFAHEGARHVYCLDFDASNFEELAQLLNKRYPDVKVTTHECDAADEMAIKDICQRALKEEGQLDVFFANAAVASAAPIVATDAEDVMEIFRINVSSCFHAVKYASAAMKVTSARKPAPGGSIVLTASVAGLRSGAGSADYSASKASVISLAQTSAWQFGGTGVRVNAVCPGLIETGMTLPVFESAKERGTAAKIGQLNPTKRYGAAEEIANAVLFLASDEASYVNGIAMPVDGGLSASHPVMPGKLA